MTSLMSFFPLSLKYSDAKLCTLFWLGFIFYLKIRHIYNNSVPNAIAFIIFHLFLYWFARVVNLKSAISEYGKTYQIHILTYGEIIFSQYFLRLQVFPLTQVGCQFYICKFIHVFFLIKLPWLILMRLYLILVML